MDKDRIEGKGRQLKGKVRSTIGRMTGNRSEQIKGKGEELGGKVEGTYGRVKDELRAHKEQRDEQRHQRGIDNEL